MEATNEWNTAEARRTQAPKRARQFVAYLNAEHNPNPGRIHPSKAGNYIMKHAIFLTALASLLSYGPAQAADTWIDITPDIKARISALRSASATDIPIGELFPIFINTQTIKRIRSVNHPGRSFIGADFSYYKYGQAQTRRIVVDCKDWFYKDGDAETKWDWVPPIEFVRAQGKTLEYATLTHLCNDASSPWNLFAMSKDYSYYYNGGYSIGNSPHYGQVRKIFVASSGVSPHLVLYASCSSKRIGLFPWEDDPGRSHAQLIPVLPLSVGEAMLDSICGFTPRQQPVTQDNEINESVHGSTMTGPAGISKSLLDRYEEEVRAQQDFMKRLMGR